MDIRPIKNDGSYKAALLEVEALMEAEPGTSEGCLLDIWATLIENYESKHFPVDLPDPVA